MSAPAGCILAGSGSPAGGTPAGHRSCADGRPTKLPTTAFAPCTAYSTEPDATRAAACNGPKPAAGDGTAGAGGAELADRRHSAFAAKRIRSRRRRHSLASRSNSSSARCRPRTRRWDSPLLPAAVRQVQSPGACAGLGGSARPDPTTFFDIVARQLGQGITGQQVESAFVSTAPHPPDPTQIQALEQQRLSSFATALGVSVDTLTSALTSSGIPDGCCHP